MSEDQVTEAALDERGPARPLWDRPGFWAVASVSTIVILLMLRFLEPERSVLEPQTEWEREQEEWEREQERILAGFEKFEEEIERAHERLQADMAGAHRRGIDRLVTENGGVELVRIPGGSFLMGSPEEEEGRWSNEVSVRRVTVPEFFIGRHEVTVEQYGRFLAANSWASPPRLWEEQQAHPRRPVVFVDWQQAKAYCHWVGGRLPTEAEWERACRAGTTTRFWSGEAESDLARVGWYQESSGGHPHDVGELPANALGLHDVHGNVAEWCTAGERLEPNRSGTKASVLRGGSWNSVERRCRSASRVPANMLAGQEPWFGFRACGGTVPGLQVARQDGEKAGEGE
ncbi:MAG: formylglycine-generating enzyme family protein [Acidobacteriota bacterium]